jgi:hypothetical protein
MSASDFPTACAAETWNKSAAASFQDKIFWFSSTRITRNPGMPEIAGMSTEHPLPPVIMILIPQMIRTRRVRGHSPTTTSLYSDINI